MRESHPCPRCGELTSKQCYCLDCANVLKRPPFVERRDYVNRFDFMERHFGKSCVVGR